MPGITGRAACIKWQYYTAAAINGYTITRAPTTGALGLVATVVERDRFKLSQRPLVFEAQHKQGAWRWPIVEFTIADSGRLTAKLGPELPGGLCLDSSNPKSSGLI
jgi:hypothetical protein